MCACVSGVEPRSTNATTAQPHRRQLHAASSSERRTAVVEVTDELRDDGRRALPLGGRRRIASLRTREKYPAEAHAVRERETCRSTGRFRVRTGSSACMSSGRIGATGSGATGSGATGSCAGANDGAARGITTGGGGAAAEEGRGGGCRFGRADAGWRWQRGLRGCESRAATPASGGSVKNVRASGTFGVVTMAGAMRLLLAGGELTPRSK
jgi:hypothetical protein